MAEGALVESVLVEGSGSQKRAGPLLPFRLTVVVIS
jgi:hypothetical protein